MPSGERTFSIMGNLDWIFKIIKEKRLLPNITSSIEIFCGAGELVWNIPPHSNEIMNDIDPQIIRAHSAIQNFTDKDIKTLESMNYVASKELFNKLKQTQPADNIDYIYQRIYFSRFGNRSGQWNTQGYLGNKEGLEASAFNVAKAKERLKNVKFLNLDGIEALKSIEDEKDIFVFLDPPYPAKDLYYEVCTLDWDKMYSILSGMQQKWMLVSSYKHTAKNLENVRSIDKFVYAKRTMEKLISNFKSLRCAQVSPYSWMFKNQVMNETEYFIIWNYDETPTWGKYFA